MDIVEIYARLEPVFRDVFDDEALVLHPNLTAKDVDEWDSVSHIRLVLTVEKAFNLRFSAHEIGKLKNAGQFVQLIHSKF